MDQYNAKKEAKIETVVESLIEALKEDKAPNTEQEKEKIITPTIEGITLVDFEDLRTMNF